ncbi:hypothetical protein [Burkholderia sp. SIMBA_062]|uniref:hypothetical protein n=1 Tax=Burkholderia sp. SIMBA_062 TaxID=3085803 RepID=UPI003978A40E
MPRRPGFDICRATCQQIPHYWSSETLSEGRYRIVFIHQGTVWVSGPAEDIFERPQTVASTRFLGSVRNAEAVAR